MGCGCQGQQYRVGQAGLGQSPGVLDLVGGVALDRDPDEWRHQGFNGGDNGFTSVFDDIEHTPRPGLAQGGPSGPIQIPWVAALLGGVALGWILGRRRAA